MSMTYTTTEAARGRDADWERRHGPSADVTTVWDFDGGQSLELTVGELEEYEQAEGVTLDEDIIGPQRFASLLEWLRDEERLEQPALDSAATGNGQHTAGPYSMSGIAGDNYIMARGPNRDRVIVAIVPGWVGIKPEEHAANKALFRAAPDLLELCQTVLLRLDVEHAERIAKGETNPHFICAALRDDLRAAIAKANGGAQ